jgi:hypothetical protein
MLGAYALLALLPTARAEVYALNDAGVTFDLPAGWEMSRWSDWDFKAKSPDGAVAIDAWYTSFQVPITADSAKGWAAVYRDRLEAVRAANVVADKTDIADEGGRPTARTTMRFTFEKGGPKGVQYIAAFPVDGKVMHVAALAAAQNGAKAEHALDTVMQRLTVQKQAAAIVALGGTVETELGFGATLPDGWRRPLASEAEATAAVIQALGIGPAEPDKCLHAIRPRPSGEADLVLFCSDPWKLGIVDDYSFADEEVLLKQHFFGKAADKVPAAVRLERNDRLGYLLTPAINGKDLRLGVLPYDRGSLVAWGVGEPGSAPDLESAIRAISGSLTFSGPDAGASVHDAGEWIVHTLTYQPWHPAVLGAGALFLAVLGGIATVVFKKAPRPTDPM